MNRNILFLFVLLAALTAEAQSPESDAADIFAGARWIAMDADSTILFPHIHLLKANSEQARSLKPYRLPVLSKEVKLRKSACPTDVRSVQVRETANSHRPEHRTRLSEDGQPKRMIPSFTRQAFQRK